jgi:hypothetical protein
MGGLGDRGVRPVSESRAVSDISSALDQEEVRAASGQFTGSGATFR